jgi:hypothetical protein
MREIMALFKKILKWTVIVIGGAFVLLVIARMPVVYNKGKTAEQVAIIHATKLTMDDVMGKNLPPDPGIEEDKTVQGIDVNKNGIRDDVELAIFKEYPNSAKTRAVLLQYALALQMEVSQPIVNKETVTAVVSEQSRAYDCIGDSVPQKDIQKFYDETDVITKFVKTRQFNTQARRTARNNFLKFIGSYSELSQKCDINLSLLQN